jgi:hypothetical protein
MVEKTAGVFTGAMFGLSINKAASFTGGAYYFTQQVGRQFGYDYPLPTWLQPGNISQGDGWASSFIRADIDSFTSKWLGASSNLTTGKVFYPMGGPDTFLRFSSNGNNYANLFNRLTSLFNSQTILLPMRLFVDRDAGGVSLLGDVPNLYLTNATSKGFTPGGIYSVGSENYMIFPNFAIRKWV